MSIRDDEDILFDEWRENSNKKIERFVCDGAAFPELYSKEKTKIIFMLKDANLGENAEESKDNRGELEKAPTGWWKKIGAWCEIISHYKKGINISDIEWLGVIHSMKDVSVLRNALAPYIFMQLKKDGGIGSISNNKLWDIVERDSDEIKRQLSIYQPDIIVCCGTGSMVKKILDQDAVKITTNFGISYWDILLNEKPVKIIDYCHPSVRVGNKVNGLIAFGLAETINYLSVEM